MNFPLPQLGAFTQFGLCVIALVAVVVMALKAYLLIVEAFGRKPPLNKELARMTKDHAELQIAVAKCVTVDALRKMENELLEKIGKSMTVQAFDEYKHERKEDFTRLEQSIKEMVTKVDEYSRVSYNGRKALHKQQNAQGQALAYLAGMVDKGGEKVRQIMARSVDEQEGELGS